jgi:hypothetical protein
MVELLAVAQLKVAGEGCEAFSQLLLVSVRWWLPKEYKIELMMVEHHDR